MPDPGVPTPSSSEADRAVRFAAVMPAGTHTTTQQWQSFEMRMRHRRAERCRLRAEVAIEAGFPDDAREALEEARQLEPTLPGLILIEERLSSATPAPPQRPPAEWQSPMGRWSLAAAAFLTLMAGLAGWLMPGEPVPPPAWAAAAAAAAPSRLPAHAPPATSTTDAEPPAVVGRASTFSTGADASEGPPATPGARATGSEPVAPPSAAAPLEPAAPVFDAPPPAPHPPTRNADALPGTAIPVPPPSAAAPSADLPPLAALASPPPEVTAEPARNPAVRVVPGTDPAAATHAEPGAEVKVRSALTRYEAAYSTLNASAARAVWPSVDANALGRAFDSLQSQQISLRDCSVAVTGQTARADCTGSATWTPKVGGGARTEPRRWTFDLEQTGGQWEIVRATAR